MIINWQNLNPETLQNVIEYFILREGTDYGVNEKSLSEKVSQVMIQLKEGKAALYWSELHETLDIKFK